MRPVIEGVVGEVAELAQDELGIAFAFDVHDPNIARAIEQQVQSFAEDVNETTWSHLRDELADGVANGENIDQLADRVEKVMGDRIRSSKETIARTETTKASTSGTLETWRQSGVVTGKQWVAALDSRTRETHVAAHGQIVGIDDVFTVGAATGPGPGQMSSARESVQCRCTIVPVLDIDMPAGGELMATNYLRGLHVRADDTSTSGPIRFVASTGGEARRTGDQNSWELENYRKNPWFCGATTTGVRTYRSAVPM